MTPGADNKDLPDRIMIPADIDKLFKTTCPSNSLWTEEAPETINVKLTKLYKARALIGFEPAIKENHKLLDLPLECPIEVIDQLRTVVKEIQRHAITYLSHDNLMSFFMRAQEYT